MNTRGFRASPLGWVEDMRRVSTILDSKSFHYYSWKQSGSLLVETKLVLKYNKIEIKSPNKIDQINFKKWTPFKRFPQLIPLNENNTRPYSPYHHPNSLDVKMSTTSLPSWMVTMTTNMKWNESHVGSLHHDVMFTVVSFNQLNRTSSTTWYHVAHLDNVLPSNVVAWQHRYVSDVSCR